jgi:hypothetical protein
MVGPEPLAIAQSSRSLTRVWRAFGTLAVLLAATAGAISSAGPAAAGAPQRTRPPASQLQQLLDQIVVAGAPGAIGLVWDGTTTERAASGVADLRTGRPMRTAVTGISSGRHGSSSASPRPIRRCSRLVPPGRTPTPATSCWV